MFKLKMKINIKQKLSLVVMFISVFLVSVFLMMIFREKIEKEQQNDFSVKLEEIKAMTPDKRGSSEPERILKDLSPAETNELLEELNQRVDLYVKKFSLLEKKEKQLESFRTDLETQKKELVSMRDKFSETIMLINKERIDLDKELVVFEGIERKNIKNLAVVYASMEPSKSAEALRQLSSETGAKVLASMPSKKSAKILEEIAPDVAAELSEQMKKLEMVNSLTDEALKTINLKALAEMYQKMETVKALALLKELKDETAVNILSYMEEKKLAKIMELMGAEEASEITEKIRKKFEMRSNHKKIRSKNQKLEGV
jgi:flagellar motility protein MotE (MotC chaperone)